MKCSYCGKENKDDSKFCEECGAKIEVEEIEENNNVEDNNFYSYNVNYKYDKEPSNIGLKIVIVLLIILIFATIGFGFWYFVLRSTGKENKESNTETVDPVKTPEPTQEPTPEPTSKPTPEPTQEPTPTPTPDNNATEVVCEYNDYGVVSRMIGKLDNNKITSIKMEMVLMSNEIAKTFYDQLKESNPEYNYVLDGNRVYLEDIQKLDPEFKLVIGLSKDDFIEVVSSGQTGMDITCR